MIITAEFVIEIQQSLIDFTGGEPGLRDYNLLDSTIQVIYQTFDQKELFPTVIEKATRLSFGLNKSHPFIDGNKRIAMHMLITVLRINGIPFEPSNEEVVKIGLDVASGNMEYNQFLNWVKIQIN